MGAYDISVSQKKVAENKIEDLELKIVYGIEDIFDKDISKLQKIDLDFMVETIKRNVEYYNKLSHDEETGPKRPEVFSRRNVAEFSDVRSDIYYNNQEILFEIANINITELEQAQFNDKEEFENEVEEFVSSLETQYGEEHLYYGYKSFEENLLELSEETHTALEFSTAIEEGEWYYGHYTFSELFLRLEYLYEIYDKESSETFSLQVGHNQGALFPELLDYNGVTGYGENSNLIYLTSYYEEIPEDGRVQDGSRMLNG